jgi:hypothetical protein
MLKFNKFIKITVDSLLLVLLLAIMIYPATTVGWLRVKTPANNQNLNVLPATTSRPELKSLQDTEQSTESTKTSEFNTN